MDWSLRLPFNEKRESGFYWNRYFCIGWCWGGVDTCNNCPPVTTLRTGCISCKKVTPERVNAYANIVLDCMKENIKLFFHLI